MWVNILIKGTDHVGHKFIYLNLGYMLILLMFLRLNTASMS